MTGKIVILVITELLDERIAIQIKRALSGSYGAHIDHVFLSAAGEVAIGPHVRAYFSEHAQEKVRHGTLPSTWNNPVVVSNAVAGRMLKEGASGVMVWFPHQHPLTPELVEEHVLFHLARPGLVSHVGVPIELSAQSVVS